MQWKPKPFHTSNFWLSLPSSCICSWCFSASSCSSFWEDSHMLRRCWHSSSVLLSDRCHSKKQLFILSALFPNVIALISALFKADSKTLQTVVNLTTLNLTQVNKKTDALDFIISGLGIYEKVKRFPLRNSFTSCNHQRVIFLYFHK